MKRAQRSELFGQAMTWLCGGALAFNLLLVIGIMGLLAWNGLGYFWQRELVQLTLKDGTSLLGEVWEVEPAHVAVGDLDAEAIDRGRARRLFDLLDLPDFAKEAGAIL